MRRRDLLKTAPLLAASGLATPAIAQGQKPLRFVPNANLSSLDPVWTTASVVIIHSLMIYDTLYGIDGASEAHPQMCAGSEVSSDGLTWTFTLRGGLVFHDGEIVRARDCAASVLRWSQRDPFGQHLASIANEMTSIDDKRFVIRLKKPFPLMLYALGSRYCFMMPERVARLPASEQLKDTIGSGPYKFLAKDWVSGSSAAYTRFDGYVPREEKPDYFAGGKKAWFQRIEWIVQPDPAVAAAALQKNEVDWVEVPLIDLCPMLRKSPGVTVAVNDPYGWLPIIQLNHLLPPFDNVKIRRALLIAANQQAVIDAIAGDQTELGRVPAGFFTEGQPMATRVGLEVMKGDAGLAQARQMVKESGYKGEPVVLIAPGDQHTIMPIAGVTRDLLQNIGLNVDYQVMDWGTMVTRRTKQVPIDQGGWNAYNTVWGGLTVSNPGSAYPLRGNGKKGGMGWPTDDRLEALRANWFDAPDLASRKAIAAQIQLQALESVPYVPMGQVFLPTAFRSEIKDIVKAAIPMFWSVRRGNCSPGVAVAP